MGDLLSLRILSLKLETVGCVGRGKWVRGVLYKGGGRGEDGLLDIILRSWRGGRAGGREYSSSLSLSSL